MLDNIALCSEMPVADENGQEEEEEDGRGRCHSPGQQKETGGEEEFFFLTSFSCLGHYEGEKNERFHYKLHVDQTQIHTSAQIHTDTHFGSSLSVLYNLSSDESFMD